MYIPKPNSVADAVAIRRMVEGVGSAELVTVGPDGTPVATLLPILWSADGSSIVMHMARANPHWNHIEPGARALAIVAGAQAYISPSWYAAKFEHGRVVPTWNYSAVHFTGTVTVYDDPEWVRAAVTELTDRHEHPREAPWAVADAPEPFVAGQLKAIVGIEMVIDSVEAKAKLSQNRSASDRETVVAGLRAGNGSREGEVADAMADAMAGLED